MSGASAPPFALAQRQHAPGDDAAEQRGADDDEVDAQAVHRAASICKASWVAGGASGRRRPRPARPPILPAAANRSGRIWALVTAPAEPHSSAAQASAVSFWACSQRQIWPCL